MNPALRLARNLLLDSVLLLQAFGGPARAFATSQQEDHPGAAMSEVQKPPQITGSQAMIPHLAANQINLVGDTNHRDNSLREYIASPAFLDAVEKAGIKFIVTENQFYLTPWVGMLSQGKITKEKFIQRITEEDDEHGVQFTHGIDPAQYRKNFADLIVNASKRGIRIICPEMLSDIPIDGDSDASVTQSRMSGDLNSALFSEAMRLVKIKEGTEGDGQKAKSSVLFYYGAAHLDIDNEIANQQGYSVGTMYVFNSEQGLKLFLGDPRLTREVSVTRFSAIYTVKEGHYTAPSEEIPFLFPPDAAPPTPAVTPAPATPKVPRM